MRGTSDKKDKSGSDVAVYVLNDVFGRRCVCAQRANTMNDQLLGSERERER
jgi:hypothetical protein